jgi:hypothetical protein
MYRLMRMLFECILCTCLSVLGQLRWLVRGLCSCTACWTPCIELPWSPPPRCRCGSSLKAACCGGNAQAVLLSLHMALCVCSCAYAAATVAGEAARAGEMHRSAGILCPAHGASSLLWFEGVYRLMFMSGRESVCVSDVWVQAVDDLWLSGLFGGEGVAPLVQDLLFVICHDIVPGLCCLQAD